MKIADIFEQRTQNQLHILKNVFVNHGIVNFKQLSSITFLSFKTVKSLWEEISLHLSDTDKLNSKQNYLFIRTQIIKESWVYQLCEQLLLKKPVSLQAFINTHYISESKFQRKKKELNDLISYLQIKIITKDGYVHVRGKELQIRMLAQQFFWAIFRGIEWPFQEIDYNKTYKFFKESIFIDQQILIKEITYTELCFIFSINLIRFNNGGVITNDELPDYAEEYFNEFPILDSFKLLLTKEFHLTQQEQYYFFFILQIRMQYYFEEDFLDQTITALKKYSVDTFYVYDEFISQLKITNPNLNESNLARSLILSANMSATLYHGFYRDTSSYLVEEYIKEKAPNLLPSIEKIVLLLKNKNPNISFLNEIKYLTIKYSEAYSLLVNMFDFEPRVTILVTTDVSIVLEELIVKKLNSIFSMYSNTLFVTTHSKFENTYDLIIKTSSTVSDVQTNKEIIIFEPDITENDINEIKLSIEQIIQNKKTIIV